MKALFLSFKLLWHRKLANAILVFEMALAVLMLAQLFVFVTDHMDSRRAIRELPDESVAVMSVFSYYDAEAVADILAADPTTESVGQVYMDGVSCDGSPCNYAVYPDALAERYRPALSAGSWFQDGREGVKQAVVSADLGAAVGETITLRYASDPAFTAVVVGVLREPTQYLFPQGGASSELFTAGAIIAQGSVVILRESDCDNLPASNIPRESGIPTNLFVFLSPDAGDGAFERLSQAYAQYGELTPMRQLKENNERQAGAMIAGGWLFFIAFACLAVTSTLSVNLMQQRDHKRVFTVYYLLGMSRRHMVTVEAVRIVFLEGLVIALTALMERNGLLMTEWMTAFRLRAFFALAFALTLSVFLSISLTSWIKLWRTDISVSLKNLHQGE